MKNKRVFVSGNFYLLHPGHLRFFNFAAELGDELIIAVDPVLPSLDLPNVQDRIEAIKSLGIGHRVLPIEGGLAETLRRLRPAIVVKGKEYADRHNPEESLVSEWGGKLVFSSGESTYFEDSLLARVRGFERVEPVRVDDFLKRNHCDNEKLQLVMSKFASLNLIVIGDTIVDEYIDSEVLGMSREDPTLVISPRRSKRFLGGAGIVAAHAAQLGAKVNFVSIVGDDSSASYVKKELEGYRVEHQLLVDESRPTTLKTRYRADGRTMFRVSHLRQHEASPTFQRKLIEAFASKAGSCQICLFSDFNYGCLPGPVFEAAIQTAKANSLFIAADSQSSSQIGDISRYQHVDLVTPTEHEARLALRDQLSGLASIAPTLLEHLNGERAILTLGRSGLIAIERQTTKSETFRSDSLPALNRNPVDVAGAGDSLLVVSAMALKLGASLFEAAFLGSIAAAIQTSRIGNLPIKLSELSAGVADYFQSVSRQS